MPPQRKKSDMKAGANTKVIIGKEEWCSLPNLGLPAIKARVDSGAKTSSIHAFNIQSEFRDGVEYVNFDIQPIQHNRRIIKRCHAHVIDKRDVKSSSGETERRYVIRTELRLGEDHWDIELTLANRDSMGFRMLLGREALTGRALIDPDAGYCMGRISEREAESKYSHVRSHKSGLKIVLLASNPDLYSNKRIIEAAEQRGHDIQFVNVKHCYMSISAPKSGIHYRGNEALDDADIVIPRLKPSVTFYGCAVTRQFETAGTFCLNDSASIARSRDKLRALQTLSRYDINMPITGFASSPLDTQDLIRMVGGAPLVVKLLEGAQGRGVVLAETNKAAESVINAFKSLRANILVQEFIKEARGEDIRCFVIDNKVVAAFQRKAQSGEFRANLHLGGTANPVKITVEEKRIAIKATKAFGLKVAGVDILRSDRGPMVLEVNSSPGLGGVEGVTGKDIAGLMIECAEKHVRDSTNKKKKA